MTFSLADFYDAELTHLNAGFEAGVHIGREDRILDVGCGAGQTTRRAARAADRGFALGLDISPSLLDEARRRTADQKQTNCFYRLGDAQTCTLPESEFDLCISRFGVMFFEDADAAFRNIARALKPGARLGLLVWGPRAANPWAEEITQALKPLVDFSGPGAAFSMSDVSAGSRLLEEAGFTNVDFEAVAGPVVYGSTVEDAMTAVGALYAPGRSPAELRAHAPLRGLLERRLTPRGVEFDALAWLIRANRPSRL